MDAEVLITSVRTDQTRNGNTRWTVSADDGGEYVTFRPPIGQAAERVEGARARISFHEEERNGFRNVYLDKVEPAPASAGGGDSDPDEAAWRTAVDAAPYLLDEKEAAGEIPPERAFEKLKPFKDLVAEDIRSGPEDPSSSERGRGRRPSA
jgi:hypothetical protein